MTARKHVTVHSREVSIDAHWRDFEPYTSMVTSGEVAIEVFEQAAREICRAIEISAGLGHSREEATQHVHAVCSQWGHLGFFDSEPRWFVWKLMNEIWGEEDEDELPY